MKMDEIRLDGGFKFSDGWTKFVCEFFTSGPDGDGPYWKIKADGRLLFTYIPDENCYDDYALMGIALREYNRNNW